VRHLPFVVPLVGGGTSWPPTSVDPADLDPLVGVNLEALLGALRRPQIIVADHDGGRVVGISRFL